jgi:hypothetical protein
LFGIRRDYCAGCAEDGPGQDRGVIRDRPVAADRGEGVDEIVSSNEQEVRMRDRLSMKGSGEDGSGFRISGGPHPNG